MLNSWLRLAPKFNLTKVAGTDFFPPGPVDVKLLDSICIGTKSNAVGDALILTALARRIKETNPRIKTRIYVKAFNPVVFYNNPFIDGIDWTPDRVYGDDANWGAGHLVELKARFFGLPPSSDPRPEIFLTAGEKHYAQKFRAAHRKAPVCILHPWGKTYASVLDRTFWERLVAEYRSRISFWQLGIEGQARIEGCDRHLMGPRSRWHLRKDFAVMNECDLFAGIDSSPMHFARAFSKPSLVFTTATDVPGYFQRRRRTPYFLHKNWFQSFLYEANTHVEIADIQGSEALNTINKFFIDNSWSTKQ